MPVWAVGRAVLAADPEQGEAGPTGLFVIILLAIGIFFLGRSMIKHMRRVPQSFDPPPEPGPVQAAPAAQDAPPAPPAEDAPPAPAAQDAPPQYRRLPQDRETPPPA